MNSDSLLSREIETLQGLLISYATGGDAQDAEYRRLRKVLLESASTSNLVPQFVSKCRNLEQFWAYIKSSFRTYAERRAFIWDEFRPALEALERSPASPSARAATTLLKQADAANISEAWSKVLGRATSDPEGAITAARTLLETVCKHILDEAGEPHGDNPDLNKLYRMTADVLKLSPSQHTEQVFKQILGGCISVVEGLGALRNRLGDAHGKGKAGVKPAPRHAELAVNLVGSLAMYFLATWDVRKEHDS